MKVQFVFSFILGAALATSNDDEVSLLQLKVSADDFAEEDERKTEGAAARRPCNADDSATPGACLASTLPSPVGTIGDVAVQAMESNDPGSRYFLWDDTRDASFDVDFIVQMPVAEHWGMSEAQRVVAEECDSGGNCDMEFNLVKCNDLSIGSMCPNNAGKCQILDSTKASASDGGKKLCIGDNDVLVDHFYNMIIKAQTHVDITSLDSPTGRFVPAIRNALMFLESEQRNVRVRMLFGNVPRLNEYARFIMDRVLPNGCLQHVEVNVGSYRVGEDSWNHGKIVAVDGEHLSYGGINLYPTDYLQKDNVYDITIHGSGTMAQTGHGYANALWNTVMSESSWGTSQTSLSRCIAGASEKTVYGTWDSCWPMPEGMTTFPPCGSSASGGVRAIPAARLGEAYLSDDTKNRNPSDHAFAAMFAAAKSSIKISSQDFGPLAGFLGWSWLWIDALSTALVNGVNVYIVFSNPFGGPGEMGNGAYGYGWTATDVIQKFRERADELCNDNGGSICKLSDEVLCQQLHVTYISAVSGQQTWENGHLVGNHAKFFAIDDQAFYVGSQNLYVCDLAEFGVIVDDATKTAEVMRQFWDPTWNQSVAIATSGSDSSCCWRTASGLPRRNSWSSAPQPLVCEGEYVGRSVSYLPILAQESLELRNGTAELVKRVHSELK